MPFWKVIVLLLLAAGYIYLAKFLNKKKMSKKG